MSQAVSTSGSLLSVIVNPGSGSPAECGVTYIESLDLDNPAVLRELDSGSYVLYGKFKAYSGDDTIIVFESKLNANIVKSTNCSSIMIFNPVNSKVECLTIYDDRYERTDVALQDVVTHIGQLKDDIVSLSSASVRFDKEQIHTDLQKQQAKLNIGVGFKLITHYQVGENDNITRYIADLTPYDCELLYIILKLPPGEYNRYRMPVEFTTKSGSGSFQSNPLVGNVSSDFYTWYLVGKMDGVPINIINEKNDLASSSYMFNNLMQIEKMIKLQFMMFDTAQIIPIGAELWIYGR